MPDCRSAPPKRNFPSQARSIVSAGPARIGAERAAEPLREADRDGVGQRSPGRRLEACRDRGVEEARAVEVDDGSAEARGLHSGAELLERPDPATGAAMGVLEHEHAARAELVDVRDLLRRRPPRVGGQALHDEAGVDRGAAPLVDQDVRPLLGDDLAARPTQNAQRGLVRHRRRRHEERRLVPEQVGHPALQLVGRRVLALLLVADLGGRHRGEHPRRRLGDGVGAEIDHRPLTLP